MKSFSLGLLAASLVLCLQAAYAADSSPVASKDGKTFVLEDINIYWLRNLGSEGLRAFFEDMVLYQEGSKLNLRPTEAEMSDYIDNVMGAQTYAQFIKLYSERAVRQLVEVTLVSRKYETYLRDKLRRDLGLTVTEAEARKYFIENIKLYHLPEGVFLSIISVETKAKAEEVVRQLQGGANFSDLAATANMDKELRDRKGELGLYRKGSGWLPQQLEEAAFKLQSGQYSPIVQGEYCHILFCHERSPEVTPSFEQVRDSLMQDMLEDKIDGPYFEAINDLMKREMPRFNIQAELFRPEEE